MLPQATAPRVQPLPPMGLPAFGASPDRDAEVDASIDDAFDALGGAPRPPSERVAAAPPPSRAAHDDRTDPRPQPAAPSPDLPWLDTGADTAPPSAIVVAPPSVAPANGAPQRTAEALEAVAARIRRGELPVPGVDADSGEEVVLAAVLAALLGARD